ncbi:hypothetical protein BDR03DRAFT_936542 [Suillus americanus]|nr:hypothetical protein BDR03DRAFT_936542 [Suillus americanus]
MKLLRRDLAKAIHMHLQSIGKYVRAQDIVDYLAQPNVQQKHSLKKNNCSMDGPKEASDKPHPHTQRVVLWFYDESTFYTNDRRKVYWVHGNETAKPRPKGEGASLMVADFVSADYGWLHSSCELLTLHRDGYFTNASILQHAELAMDILNQHYPHDRHVLVFNNASTHLKRADDALSAHHMPKFPTKPGNIPFGVERTVIGSDGKPVHGADGKALNKKCFYFPEGHEHAGGFKGMAKILKERGFEGCEKLHAECPNFRCNPNINHCCCRCLLYNQPDFLNVKSNIELACEKCSYKVLFLPKFHCELNFIKHSSEAVLMQNIIDSLDAVPLVSMQKFATRSLHFMDAYHKGLNGKQAAFAMKKYCGHHTLPLSVFNDLAELN